MDYGALIRQAGTITWRYRFLWLLGVLAGGAIGRPTFNRGGGSVNVGLAIATGITFGLGLVGARLLLGGIGALVFTLAGLTPPTIAYISLGGLVLIVGALTLAGIANAFFWTYRALAYPRLSGRAPVTAAG